MAVNITYAFCDNELVHIDGRISKNKNYYCPSCGEALTPKKGPINAHHFAHQSGSSCTASEETMLHLISKYVLVSGDKITLNFPISILQTNHSLLRKMVTQINLDYFPIDLDEILDFYSFYHPIGNVEQPIESFIADVLFIELEDETKLVIEVFVTHAMEEDKKNRFNQLGIPFIEVKPVMNNGDIAFFVTETNVTKFFDKREMDFKNEMFSYVYYEHRAELLQKFTEDLVAADKIVLAKNEALRQLDNDLDTINLRSYINRKLYTEMSTISATTTGKYERVESLSPANPLSYRGRSLTCNNKYVNSEKGILYSLITRFMAENISVEAFINTGENNKEYISGFNFRIPRLTITGDSMKDILKKMIQEMESIPTPEPEVHNKLFY